MVFREHAEIEGFWSLLILSTGMVFGDNDAIFCRQAWCFVSTLKSRAFGPLSSLGALLGVLGAILGFLGALLASLRALLSSLGPLTGQIDQDGTKMGQKPAGEQDKRIAQHVPFRRLSQSLFGDLR